MSWDFTADSEIQRELAELLKKESENYDAIVNDMYKEITNMGDYWNGEDYEMFKNSTMMYHPALADLSNGIKMYSKHLNKLAESTDALATELINIIENMTESD